MEVFLLFFLVKKLTWDFLNFPPSFLLITPLHFFFLFSSEKKKNSSILYFRVKKSKSYFLNLSLSLPFISTLPFFFFSKKKKKFKYSFFPRLWLVVLLQTLSLLSLPTPNFFLFQRFFCPPCPFPSGYPSPNLSFSPEFLSESRCSSVNIFLSPENLPRRLRKTCSSPWTGVDQKLLRCRSSNGGPLVPVHKVRARSVGLR